MAKRRARRKRSLAQPEHGYGHREHRSKKGRDRKDITGTKRYFFKKKLEESAIPTLEQS